MRVISWNINGLSDRKKIRQAIQKLRLLRADVIILQEVYKNNTRLSPTQVEQKVDEIQEYVKFFWKTDMYFNPHGRIETLSNLTSELKITITSSNGGI